MLTRDRRVVVRVLSNILKDRILGRSNTKLLEDIMRRSALNQGHSGRERSSDLHSDG